MTRALYADFVRTFGNVLFAVSLFCVWGLLTLIGVVVDQGRDTAVYFQSYPPAIARALLRLNLENVYHSPWYVGIVGLILLSLAVCTFKRVIPARLVRLHPVNVETIPLHATFDVQGEPSDVRTRLAAFFTARGWRVREKAFGGVEWSFADKHNWARRGVLVAHAGFTIIAAGATIYWARGFSGQTAIVTGQAATIPQTHAVIRLNRFAYTIDPIMTKGGMVYQPVAYVSHVTVTGKNGVPTPMTVRVNHPIDVDGTLYYQASYGFATRFVLKHDGAASGPLAAQTLLEGASLDVPGTQRTVTYERFVPTVDRQTGMPSADPRVNDPAIVLSASDAGSSMGAVLVPLGTTVPLGQGWSVTPQRYLLYSGIQYRYDPGVPLVGIGAFVLLAGLVISFYFLPARLYVRVDEEQAGRSRVGVAATTVKGYDVFEEEFRRIVLALRGQTA